MTGKPQWFERDLIGMATQVMLDETTYFTFRGYDRGSFVSLGV